MIVLNTILARVSGAMLLTRAVPTGVPSLAHSSRPVLGKKLKVSPSGPSDAAKNTLFAKLVSEEGEALSVPGSMSRSLSVPSVVPSLVHSS